MAITASQVSELRQLTSCGMMDCKKALMETNGDMDQAIQVLRKKGIAKAASRADRAASEGIIRIKSSADGKQAILVEINCETDFVARDSVFQQFADDIADIALANQCGEVKELLDFKTAEGKTIDQVRQELISKVGENVVIHGVAFVKSTGIIGAYVHGGRIGVLVTLTDGDVELAKDIAMHIAASKPVVVSPDEVAEELIAKEKEIFMAQASETGKPQNIVEKIVEGRLKKFLDEVSLLGQQFVKDPNITVGQLLKEKKAGVDNFVRFELGKD